MPSLPKHVRLLVVFSVAVCAACNPDLPERTPRVGPPGTEGHETVDLEPPAPLDAAPRVLRIHLQGPAALDFQPDGYIVARGELGPAHLRQLQRGELSKALSARLVPIMVWARDVGA